MYSVILLAAMSANGPDAVSFGRRGAGCVGTQASCVSAQAGCTSTQASCRGLFGHGLLRRPLLNRRNHGCYGCAGGQASAPVKQPIPQPMPKQAACPDGNCPVQLTAVVTVTCDGDALEEVNTARARRGLRPFQRDGLLMAAARRCAEFRAANRIAGHTANDFQFVQGTTAVAAGSGALEPSWGWGTCCTHEDWTYAGAAVVMGQDGKRYMQLFVR